jgi:hypothetical protein
MTETVKQRPEILVIDDDKQVRNLLRETLIGENEWVVASSAESKIRADSGLGNAARPCLRLGRVRGRTPFRGRARRPSSL